MKKISFVLTILFVAVVFGGGVAPALDDDCGDGVNRLVRKGSVDQDTGSFGNGSSSGPRTLPPLSLGRGESLDFIVGPGAANNHGCDGTELDVQVTTPDPLAVIYANNANGPVTLTKGTPISLDVTVIYTK